MYRWLAEAVSHAGSPRSVYSQDTTLTRRGLLQRADRRARELANLGVHSGEIVILSMGNVVEFLVLMLAASKLGLVVMPIDPSSGDPPLVAATSRMPARAVIRRPRGMETSAPEYPDGYEVRSRKRLSGSLLTVDVLSPPDDLPGAVLSPDAELVLETRSRGGTMRDVVRTGTHLRAICDAAISALELHSGTRLVCAQPFTVPRFFDPVVIGWLGSEAQLVMGEGPVLETVLPTVMAAEHVVVVDSVRQFLDLGRSLRASGSKARMVPVIPQSTVPLGFGRDMKQAFGESPRQLLLLEEIGILAGRLMQRGEHFVPATGVELRAGATMEVGGREVLAQSPQASDTIPLPAEDEPGATADDDDWRHTGYAGKFGKQGALQEILGRDDGVVNLEGRRACLDSIEESMLTHRRVTWVRAELEHTSDGDPQVRLEYRATGSTEVDDIEEHAVGHLPPFMVPRSFARLAD
jgi:acyl-CoA synthetase (AMP-forming)/AMP-acid ligase II